MIHRLWKLSRRQTTGSNDPVDGASGEEPVSTPGGFPGRSVDGSTPFGRPLRQRGCVAGPPRIGAADDRVRAVEYRPWPSLGAAHPRSARKLVSAVVSRGRRVRPERLHPGRAGRGRGDVLGVQRPLVQDVGDDEHEEDDDGGHDRHDGHDRAGRDPVGGGSTGRRPSRPYHPERQAALGAVTLIANHSVSLGRRRQDLTVVLTPGRGAGAACRRRCGRRSPGSSCS